MSNAPVEPRLADCYCHGTGVRMDERFNLEPEDKVEITDDLGLYFRITLEDVAHGEAATVRVEVPCRQRQPPRPEEPRSEP